MGLDLNYRTFWRIEEVNWLQILKTDPLLLLPVYLHDNKKMKLHKKPSEESYCNLLSLNSRAEKFNTSEILHYNVAQKIGCRA